MTTATKITVTTDLYERTWGHGPKGRGSWLFDMRTPDGRRGQFSRSGTYGEALEQAKAHARANGVNTIEILP